MEDSGTNVGIDTTQLGDPELQLWEKIQRGEPIARNINEEHEKRLTAGERVSDRVASTIGSWRFIIIMSVILAAWITLNIIGWIRSWDPYPFILLNLVLSFQAAYAAPVIMMSQNRQGAKDRLRSEQDYETNRMSGIAVAHIHERIEEILELQKRQMRLLERSTSHTDEPSS
jgi:uncharacterized membrane protein